VSVWDNTPSATRRGRNVSVPNLSPDVFADGPRASQYTPARPTSHQIWYCHVTAASRIVPHPFLGISVSDFRKFKCTTHKNFRECVVYHTLFECVGNATCSQSVFLPECLGRHNRGPDGVAAWNQEGARRTEGKGVLCAGQALCPSRVRFTLNSTVLVYIRGFAVKFYVESRTIGITRVEDLIATTRYSKLRNPPPPSSQHGCSWCGCRGIAKNACTVALSQWPS